MRRSRRATILIMNDRASARIGILGGMGPEAGIALLGKVVAAERVVRDQDHIPAVLDSDPTIPDRTAFLLGRGPDPLPAMIAAGTRLAACGVTVAGVGCMTAHAFLEGLRAALPFRILSAFEELARSVAADYPAARSLGILATSGSRASGIYERNLGGYRCLWPSPGEQESLVMEAIYGKDGIKAGNRGEAPRALLRRAAESLAAAGAELVVAGCTEIPLALSQSDVGVPLLDPMRILAEALVREARA
jgi:aspartate racemase